MNLITEIHEKLEKYKIINPLEYVKMIITTDLRKRGLFIVFNNIHLNIISDPDTLKNVYISFTTKTTNTYYTKDDISFFARIDVNNFKILNDFNPPPGNYDNIYDIYTKIEEFKEILDFLVELNILTIDHKNKCICICIRR